MFYNNKPKMIPPNLLTQRSFDGPIYSNLTYFMFFYICFAVSPQGLNEEYFDSTIIWLFLNGLFGSERIILNHVFIFSLFFISIYFLFRNLDLALAFSILFIVALYSKIGGFIVLICVLFRIPNFVLFLIVAVFILVFWEEFEYLRNRSEYLLRMQGIETMPSWISLLWTSLYDNYYLVVEPFSAMALGRAWRQSLDRL